MSPSLMNDTVTRDISDSAFMNKDSQMKTHHAKAFHSPSTTEQRYRMDAEQVETDHKMEDGSGQLLNVQTDPSI